MKKILLMGAAVCAVFMMSSCKSKESAYKKAYEKAKAQQTETTTTTPVQQVTTQTTVTPVTTAPVADYSNVAVRNESVAFVEGSPLKQYGVVVASVTIKSNGVALMQKLAGQGYNSCLAQAQVNGQTFYRVVACSYDTKPEAAQKRDQLEGQYPGAWLLYKK
ncbi:MAG: SPOR domain-containing protein [Bacteroidaceae bacterium]|jgi:cell division septation protein DedD|nr:SPOR domain-containing protein [Bacteroidaceae bacterium]